MMSSEEIIDQKPFIEIKSSNEILSELFGTFNADAPVIVKKEKDDTTPKKHKKSKKKHKKHKKSKKKKRSSSVGSSSSGNSGVDLSELLIKKEPGDDDNCLSETLKNIINLESIIKTEVKQEDVKEEGEIEDNIMVKKEDKEKHKTKKRKREHDEEKKAVKKHKKRDLSAEKNKSSKDDHKHKERRKKSNDRDKSKDRDRYKDRTKDHDDYNKHREDFKYRSPTRSSRDDFYKHKYRDRSKDRDDYKYKEDRYRDDRRYKHKDFYQERSDDRYSNNDKGYSSFRARTDRDKDSERIDKKKLLEIARRNAIQMMKSGNLPGALTLGPQAQEKVIAAIRSGGKTVEELTDFCKSLSKKEELGEISSISEDSDSDGDQPFHHPFQIKDKPLTINIKNAIPLPIKSNQERASELRIQFPVSSGQQHRKTEAWIPVSPKKTEEPKALPAPPQPVAAPVVAPVPAPVPMPLVPLPSSSTPSVTALPVSAVPTVFSNAAENKDNVDIAAIVSQRLLAMRKLQENPHDVIAITQMYKAQKEMNTWAESKQQVGQFTGSTGAQILSQAELSSGYQAWARKDQLQTAAPVTGGMGMHLLQKMGWRPGEGLGKEKTGALEPLLLEVKLDKKGIVAKEEQQKKKVPKAAKQTVKTLQGKHPVSLLGEYASKRKLGAPQYVVDFECGPDHKKNFLFKVVLNGVEYKPNVASGNKKDAKANAASVCLQQLGLLTS